MPKKTTPSVLSAALADALAALAGDDPKAAYRSLTGAREALLTVEERIFRAALEQVGWNAAEAAKLLGIAAYTTFISRLSRKPAKPDHLTKLRDEYEQRQPRTGPKSQSKSPPARRATHARS